MAVIHSIIELLGYIPEQIVFREPYGRRWRLKKDDEEKFGNDSGRSEQDILH